MYISRKKWWLELNQFMILEFWGRKVKTFYTLLSMPIKIDGLNIERTDTAHKFQIRK